MIKDTSALYLPKEQSVYGKWENGYSFPYQNSITGIYYARDIYDGNIIKNSYCNSLRQLRRKMNGYISEHLIEQKAAF